MVVLRDLRGLDADEETTTTVWAARALVDAMVREAGAGQPGSRGARTGVGPLPRHATRRYDAALAVYCSSVTCRPQVTGLPVSSTS
jgi:hypothetical protein